MKPTILFCAILALFACKSNKKGDTKANTTTNQPMVSLETTPCRGYCPVFKLTFMDNGAAQYEPIRFVKSATASTFQLTAEELETLKKKLNGTNLWQYPESFKTQIMDAPGATLIAHRGVEQKTVRGSVERPKPIKDLQAHLEQLAKIHGIDLGSADPNELPDNGKKTELLVKLKPDINAGNWLRDLNNTSKANLRLVRRVTAENIWVVAFDGAVHPQAEMLDLLRANEHVLEAQPNSKADDRN